MHPPGASRGPSETIPGSTANASLPRGMEKSVRMHQHGRRGAVPMHPQGHREVGQNAAPGASRSHAAQDRFPAPAQAPTCPGVGAPGWPVAEPVPAAGGLVTEPVPEPGWWQNLAGRWQNQ